MVAQSSANFPIYCGHARQCGQGFRLVNVLSTCEKLLLTKKQRNIPSVSLKIVNFSLFTREIVVAEPKNHYLQ